MFAANGQCDSRLCGPPAICAELQKFPDTLCIEHMERIFGKDTLLHIVRHKATGIVA